MRALLLTLVVLGACDAGAKHEPRPEPDTLQKAPIIIVTKGEITYQGQLVATVDSSAHVIEAGNGHPIDAANSAEVAQSVSCTRVLQQLRSAVFAYDPQYIALSATFASKVVASCQDDAWPDELKRCIVDATPEALAHAHACENVVPAELWPKIAKRFGVSRDSLPQATSSPTTNAQ
jgi:hypothetical protein